MPQSQREEISIIIVNLLGYRPMGYNKPNEVKQILDQRPQRQGNVYVPLKGGKKAEIYIIHLEYEGNGVLNIGGQLCNS